MVLLYVEVSMHSCRGVNLASLEIAMGRNGAIRAAERKHRAPTSATSAPAVCSLQTAAGQLAGCVLGRVAVYMCREGCRVRSL